MHKIKYFFKKHLKNIPVNADTTLFRIGSTSKLITWTAVMQLVEDGKLGLDTDVNTYLDFEIPRKLIKSLKNTTTEPITITHLMTHTADFEDYPEIIHIVAEQQIEIHPQVVDKAADYEIEIPHNAAHRG